MAGARTLRGPTRCGCRTSEGCAARCSPSFFRGAPDGRHSPLPVPVPDNCRCPALEPSAVLPALHFSCGHATRALPVSGNLYHLFTAGKVTGPHQTRTGRQCDFMPRHSAVRRVARGLRRPAGEVIRRGVRTQSRSRGPVPAAPGIASVYHRMTTVTRPPAVATGTPSSGGPYGTRPPPRRRGCGGEAPERQVRTRPRRRRRRPGRRGSPSPCCGCGSARRSWAVR